MHKIIEILRLLTNAMLKFLKEFSIVLIGQTSNNSFGTCPNRFFNNPYQRRPQLSPRVANEESTLEFTN